MTANRNLKQRVRARARGAGLVHFPEGALTTPGKRVMSSTGPDHIGPADWDRAGWAGLARELDEVTRLADQLRLSVRGGTATLWPARPARRYENPGQPSAPGPEMSDTKVGSLARSIRLGTAHGGVLMGASTDDQNQSPQVRAAHQRPRWIIASTVLLIISAVLWIPLAGHFTVNPTEGLVALLLILYVVLALLAAGGRERARTGVSVVAMLLLFFLAPYAVLGFRDPDRPYGPEYAVMDMVALAACCAGVAFFYRRGSNAYFRARRRP